MKGCSTLDDVYFGARRVDLSHVAGTAERWNPQRFREAGPGRQRIIGRGMRLPSVPAPDIERVADEEESAAMEPEALARPLLKVAPGRGDSGLYAVESGKRSALVRVDGAWYRLKGCGNETAGIVVEERRDGAEERVCVRARGVVRDGRAV